MKYICHFITEKYIYIIIGNKEEKNTNEWIDKKNWCYPVSNFPVIIFISLIKFDLYLVNFSNNSYSE